MLVPCAYIYKGPIATTSRSRCPLQKPTASSADCWRNQAFAMETKVVCLTLAFLVLAMEINAVPVGPSDLVEDTWMPNLVKRVSNKKVLSLRQCTIEIRDYRRLSNQCKKLLSDLVPFSDSNMTNME
ncbi:uncharacterized protein LOC111136836 isoform X4 [Crassostrea virginica]